MSDNEILSKKERELIAVGASISAGCRPCTEYHVRAAREAGSTDVEIGRAVDSALGVRHDSTQIMARFARDLLGGDGNLDAPIHPDSSILDELVSLAAGLALNCAASVEHHVAVAGRLGASERQVRAALGVARMVKKVADEKVEVAAAAAGASAGPVEADADDSADGCGCDKISGG